MTLYISWKWIPIGLCAIYFVAGWLLRHVVEIINGLIPPERMYEPTTDYSVLLTDEHRAIRDGDYRAPLY